MGWLSTLFGNLFRPGPLDFEAMDTQALHDLAEALDAKKVAELDSLAGVPDHQYRALLMGMVEHLNDEPDARPRGYGSAKP